MKKEYSIDDFEMLYVLYREKGYWENNNPYCYGISDDGEFRINYSSILSTMIRIAGKTCEHYASDLFISWSALMEELKGNPDYQGGKYLFGFRKNGVDHTEFVLQRYNAGYAEEIDELYMVEITTGKTDYDSVTLSGNEYAYITMTFGKAALTEKTEN